MLKTGSLFLILLMSNCCLLAQPVGNSIFNISDSTTVTGKIDGYSISQEEQFINYYVYDITGRDQKFVASIQPNGKFSFRFLQKYEGDFDLQYGANRIKAYAQPGEKIEIEIDNNVADKVFHFPGAFKISGHSAIISHHMLRFFAIYLPKMYERGMDIKLPVDEFVDLQHRNLQLDLELLNNYNAKNDPPEKFRNWAKNWLTYSAAELILLRPFLGRANSSLPDTQLLGYLRNIDIVNEQALDNAEYYRFLSGFIGRIQMLISNNIVYSTPGDLQKSTVGITMALQKIDRYFSGIIREIAYYDCYSFNAHSEVATVKLEQVWNKFDEVINNNFLQQTLESKRNSSINAFTPYNVIDRINKMDVDSILKKRLLAILEKEKGRYVYIDFWGSWCAPCMAEMPYYRAFIEELKDEPVNFLFLAVETSAKDMQKTQEKHAIPGTFISLNKNDADIANEVFGFSGYPSHFLLDPNGNLLTKNLIFREGMAAHVKWFIR